MNAFIHWFSYDWLRAIHIIAVIAWMAGLLIYPRLLVYRLEGAGNAQLEAMMDKAADAARKIIIAPTMILVWVMGLMMLWHNWGYLHTQVWMWVKLALVTLLSGYHGWIIGVGKKVARGETPVTPKRLRMLNEIPMVIAIFAVIMVVVQPF
ncbi:MAG: CopD family protein [Hyphomonadaceae bacterium]